MGTTLIIASLMLSVIWMAICKPKMGLTSGLVIGNIFFALIPMALAPFAGPIIAEDLPVGVFTSASATQGLYVFLFSMSLLLASEWSRRSSVSQNENDAHNDKSVPTMAEFWAAFILSITFMFLEFVNSGKLGGAHWAAAADAGIFGSIVSLVSLSLRAYIFAISIFLLPTNSIRILIALAVFTMIDIVLTGNRITVLYFVFSILASRAFRSWELGFLAFITAPIVFLMVTIYPAFRGVVWSEFGGFEGFRDAFWYVWDNEAPTAFGMDKVYNIFEAANVAIFQYVFETFGDTHPFLYGETVLLKPAAFLIPREIWADKPLGLGARLGIDVFGIDGLSLNSLLLGEFYANFGWFSPALLFIILIFMDAIIRGTRFNLNDKYNLSLFVLAFGSWRHEFNYLIICSVVITFIFIFVPKIWFVRNSN